MSMRRVNSMIRSKALLGTVAGLAALAGCGAASSGTIAAYSGPSSSATVTIGHGTVGPAIPSGFTGISTELPALLEYAGPNPKALNPVFVQLIKNLAPGQRPVLRIGGDSTDWTWYRAGQAPRPPWVRYTLRKPWFQVGHALAAATNARMILGVNLEADSRSLAGAQAGAMINGIGRSSVDALELGNEPELYPSFSWYKTPAGVHIRGRPHSYGFTSFTQDFAGIARALPRATIAGPAVGGPLWSPILPQFLSGDREVGLATMHRYPLKKCVKTQHVTIAQMLAESSSLGLAQGTRRYVATARAHHVPLRIDEMNSVSCGGESGISNTFASSLWSLDALFGMASIGVQGINIHTVPNATDQLFSFANNGGRWRGRVEPTYYGMLLFAQAAPAGSHILRLSGTTRGPFRAWATRDTTGVTRVVLINTQTARGETVTVNAPGGAPASFAKLTAPRVTARTGISLGGQSFGASTTTGQLSGTASTAKVTPKGGGYRVSLAPASAGILTIPTRSAAAPHS